LNHARASGADSVARKMLVDEVLGLRGENERLRALLLDAHKANLKDLNASRDFVQHVDEFLVELDGDPAIQASYARQIDLLSKTASLLLIHTQRREGKNEP